MNKKFKKEVREYCKKTNFYKISLVKKYLKKMHQKELETINKVPKIVCPNCSSKHVSVEYDGDEYSSDSYLYCDDCEFDFDDTFGYISAKEEVECLSWTDRIEVDLYFEHPDIKSYKWQEFCQEQIKIYLGIIKEKYIF